MTKRKTFTYAVAAATAATFSLAGCNGGDEDPTAAPTSTSSASSSASPITSASPTASATPKASASASAAIPAAARPNTQQGAIAFVRFYFEQVNLAYKKPDVTLLPPLATTSCSSCAGLQDGVVEMAADGQRMKSNLVAPIPTASIASGAPAKETWIKFTLTQLTVPVIDKSGKELDGQKASAVGKIVSVIREGNQWRVQGIANQA